VLSLNLAKNFRKTNQNIQLTFRYLRVKRKVRPNS